MQKCFTEEGPQVANQQKVCTGSTLVLGYRPRCPSLVGVSLRLRCLSDIKKSNVAQEFSPNRVGLPSCISTAKLTTRRNCKTGLEDWLFSGSDARPSRGSSKPGRGPGHLTNTPCLREDIVCCNPMSRPEDSRKLFSFTCKLSVARTSPYSDLK